MVSGRDLGLEFQFFLSLLTWESQSSCMSWTKENDEKTLEGSYEVEIRKYMLNSW